MISARPLVPNALAQQAYVLTAPAWGPDQAAALAAAGGTVVFGHEGAGVGVATSTAPDFAARVRASGAIASVEADRLVQWQMPMVIVDVDEA